MSSKAASSLKCRGVLGVKRFAHVEAVEPHLRRVDLLVPEAAFGSARMCLQLFAEEGGGFPVFFLAGGFVKEEEIAAGKNVIDVVLVERVGANGAVVGDEVVDAALDEVEVLFVVRGGVDALDAFQDEAVIVGPLRGVADSVAPEPDMAVAAACSESGFVCASKA